MTREEAIRRIKAWNLDSNDMEVLSVVIPELRESEDERLRKLLVWQVHRNIEDETNDLAGSVYDGIKGHDPDLEESIEDWKKCLAYLEKQKEREMPDSTELIELWGEEKEILREKDFRGDGWRLAQNAFMDGVARGYGIKQKEQMPVEWSEEDEAFLKVAIAICNRYSHKDIADWLKSLRPRPKVDSVEYERGFLAGQGSVSHWKPSKEQMDALDEYIWAKEPNKNKAKCVISLYEDLKKLM